MIGRLEARASTRCAPDIERASFGLIDLGLFTYPVIYPYIGPALLGMVIVGVPGAGMMAGIATMQQQLAADSHRGRVVGAMRASAPSAPDRRVGAGFLGELVPILLLVVVQGSGYVIGSLTVAWLTRGQRVPTTRLAVEGQAPAPD